MVKKIVWSKKMSREYKKAVRDFLKDYDCDDLTVVFADKWRFRATNDKEYSINTGRSRSTCGLFYRDSGVLIDYAGMKYITTPAIIVNMESREELRCRTWQSTFIHEVGHYIDWKTDPEGFRRKSTKAKEKFAREFSALKTLSL